MQQIETKQDALSYSLKQVISNLKKSWIEDITTEDVKYVKEYESGKKEVVKIRFYTEEQWLNDSNNKATTAQIVLNKHYKGCKLPFTIVQYDNTTYFVDKLEK